MPVHFRITLTADWQIGSRRSVVSLMLVGLFLLALSAYTAPAAQAEAAALTTIQFPSPPVLSDSPDFTPAPALVSHTQAITATPAAETEAPAEPPAGEQWMWWVTTLGTCLFVVVVIGFGLYLFFSNSSQPEV